MCPEESPEDVCGLCFAAQNKLIYNYCTCPNLICVQCQNEWLLNQARQGKSESCPWCRRDIRHTAFVAVENDEYRVKVDRHKHTIKVYTLDAGRERLFSTFKMEALRTALSVLVNMFADVPGRVKVSQVHSHFMCTTPTGIKPDELYFTELTQPSASELNKVLRVFMSSQVATWRQFEILDAELEQYPLYLYDNRRHRLTNARVWMAHAYQMHFACTDEQREHVWRVMRESY